MRISFPIKLSRCVSLGVYEGSNESPTNRFLFPLRTPSESDAPRVSGGSLSNQMHLAPYVRYMVCLFVCFSFGSFFGTTRGCGTKDKGSSSTTFLPPFPSTFASTMALRSKIFVCCSLRRTDGKEKERTEDRIRLVLFQFFEIDATPFERGFVVVSIESIDRKGRTRNRKSIERKRKRTTRKQKRTLCLRGTYFRSGGFPRRGVEATTHGARGAPLPLRYMHDTRGSEGSSILRFSA